MFRLRALPRPSSATWLLLGALFSGSLIWPGCNSDDPASPASNPPGPAPVLEPEPPFSPGAENTLVWSSGSGTKGDDREFLVQKASDSTFAGEVENSGWITGTSHTFDNLAHGSSHHYRVRGRDAQGVETTWSDPQSSTQDAMPPVAEIAELKAEQTSLLFDFELKATDPVSGIAEIELWFSKGGAPVALYGSFPPGEIRYQATEGGVHEFHALAVDGSGNRQQLALTPTGVTLVPEPIIITDAKGEDFDITAAVLEFHMGLPYWEYGLGRYAIQPIIDPKMLAPGDVFYPEDSQFFDTFGLEIGDDVRAYRKDDLVSREVVDDVVDGVPVAVIYCPLCDSHGIYNRVLDGETLTIAASGWTWQQIFVLQDYETGSLWFPGLSFPGTPEVLRCIAGPLQGKKLFAVYSQRVIWKSWKNAYPGSLIMWTK